MPDQESTLEQINRLDREIGARALLDALFAGKTVKRLAKQYRVSGRALLTYLHLPEYRDEYVIFETGNRRHGKFRAPPPLRKKARLAAVEAITSTP